MASNYVTLGKDQYHLHLEMEQWCSQQFGKGKWIQDFYPETWEGMNCMWTIHSMFGNTTFAFKRNSDYTLFVLRWL